MANNRELSQFADFLNVDEGVNNNVGIATTVRISGGDDYHENRPPYYALAFIMKT